MARSKDERAYLVDVDKALAGAACPAGALSVDLTNVVAHLMEWLEQPALPRHEDKQCALEQRLRRLSPKSRVPTQRFGHFFVNPAEREWEFTEVHRQVGQMAVLAIALRSERLAKAFVSGLSPTQQPGYDASGLLDGGCWALEVFGGIDVTNNRKRAKDVKTLGAFHGRRFFACWETAWRRWPGTKWKVKQTSGDGVLLVELLADDNRPISEGMR